MHGRNRVIDPHSKISAPCIQKSKFEASPLESRKRSITTTTTNHHHHDPAKACSKPQTPLINYPANSDRWIPIFSTSIAIRVAAKTPITRTIQSRLSTRIFHRSQTPLQITPSSQANTTVLRPLWKIYTSSIPPRASLLLNRGLITTLKALNRLELTLFTLKV